MAKTKSSRIPPEMVRAGELIQARIVELESTDGADYSAQYNQAIGLKEAQSLMFRAALEVTGEQEPGR